MKKRKVRIGINGFGRIGRLVLRAGIDHELFEFVQINDPAADGVVLAHLLEFDSTHGRWLRNITSDLTSMTIDGQRIRCTAEKDIKATDWSHCDLVIDASGKNKTSQTLQYFLDQGVDHVVVTAPVKAKEIPNIVVGVNDEDFDPREHSIVSAASCTTNCMAPVVKVIQEHFGIERGSMTTIHALTSSQHVLDSPSSDLRRARAGGESLIPTSTGAAKAIINIFPELAGRLNGHAVRVPVVCPSLTDMVFEVKRATNAEEVNKALAQAAEGELEGILGYEERPLVSIDYKSDPRSSIIDAGSTLVIDETHVKIYAWYDNEAGYAHRVLDLAERIAVSTQ